MSWTVSFDARWALVVLLTLVAIAAGSQAVMRRIPVPVPVRLFSFVFCAVAVIGVRVLLEAMGLVGRT